MIFERQQYQEDCVNNIIDEIEKDLVYKVDSSIFVLGECKTDLGQYSGSRIYIDGYATISLENWLNMLGLNKETVKILY